MRMFTRDRWDKKIAGVCGGLGRFLQVDPTLVRLFLTLTCILTGVLPLLVCYFVASIAIPLGPPVYIQFTCKKLYRSKKERKLAGVCGGVGELIKVDPTIIRFLFLIAMILTGVFPIFITYIVGAFIIPEEPARSTY